ncbi:Dyp-type peroxidase [Nonomuraea purpurea]|uniref:Dyp-type peroxidase n=1 Tax=Nonomuraea purpurea TaxID=1849276 RepID=A0ABV8FXB2_9ACTN
MPVDLENQHPLAWDSPTLDADTKAMLDNLQPNILHAHVREHMSVLLVQFNDAAEGKAFLRNLASTKMKSARTHLEELRDFVVTGMEGTPYVGVGVSQAGYHALGHSDAEVSLFADETFRAGMKQRITLVSDPPVEEWEQAYRLEIHAVILIGDATPGTVDALREEILGELPASAQVLGKEIGLGLRNPAGDGIEHFGYVDGRSQPLFLKDDVDAEPATVWNPFFPLGNALLPDPLSPNPVQHHGSYLVFRKLEQNVRAFRQIEQDLANGLSLTGIDRERAGAMLVGRFRDGTPLTSKPKPSGGPVPNDFVYDGDDGTRCPFSAHIRKTNPRSFGREVLMARRGQTYGTRTDQPWDDSPPQDRPTGGVGLLFMAFNGALVSQFEFTQQKWANNPKFQKPGTGLDPVIGQGPRDLQVSFPKAWGQPELSPPQAQVAQTVTMKGGEYFFAPSLAYLRGL